jgi:hypothetical protein
MHLFSVTSPQLAARLALQRPLRTCGPLPPFGRGSLQAPVVHGAIARLAIAGCAELLAWDAAVACDA